MENPVVSVKSLAIPRATRLSTGGFTLMEILVVLAVIAILIALTVPTLSSLSGSTSLATGTRQVSNYLTLARTEAIKRHTVTRFVVVTGASETEDVSYRRYGIWEWNPEYEDGEDPRRWRPLSSWQDLPLDAVFEPDPPTYIRDSIYAEKDGASIRGDFFFQDEANVFEEMTGGEEFKMQYIEFTPSGAARQRGGTERNIMVVLTAGIIAPGESDEGEPTIVYKNAEEGSPNNWAQINVDTLTGRVRIYRP
ncbi:MAG: prepilin-type N-terminal cleavage/methylation domain-containing protein [Verrucomicrobiota bacterium]